MTERSDVVLMLPVDMVHPMVVISQIAWCTYMFSEQSADATRLVVVGILGTY